MGASAESYRGCNTPVKDPPDVLVSRLAEQLSTVQTESVPSADVVGRVLAQPILADRDNPPVDVSAMDGYAVRLADTEQTSLPVSGEVMMGESPVALPPGSAMRVFTGGAVPDGAELVVRREFTDESSDYVSFHQGSADLMQGVHIRHRGENVKAGEVVVDTGRLMTASQVSSLAAFGITEVEVYQRVRVTVVVTGDELRRVDQDLPEAGIRDSNGPTLRAMLASHPWVQLVEATHASDDPEVIKQTLGGQLSNTDVLITTGGVSMGDHDYVPRVFKDLGCEVAFHGLAVRPGRPMLGAVGPDGQLVMGLPGNPVSAVTTLTRFGLPMMYKQAGGTDQAMAPTLVRVINPDKATLGLDWFRPVSLTGPGEAQLQPLKGSGDLAGLSRSDGFVEQTADQPIPSVAPFWRWWR